MIPCSLSRSYTAIFFTLLIWISQLSAFVAAATNYRDDQASPITSGTSPNDTHPGLICTPFGACEPCPENARHEPFCQPFGNRRLMHCISANSSSLLPPGMHGQPPGPPPHPNGGPPYRGSPPIDSDTDFDAIFKSQHPEGETPAWESCGRIVEQERADFLEFVACNILFVGIGLVILGIRSRRLHALQARQLAARIGMIRNNVGSRR